MSLPRQRRLFVQSRSAILSFLLAGTAVTASAQYPGLVKKPDSKIPVMRSIAVLEWVGAPGKPSASRLLPVSVFDGEQLNDGTIYLTRPQPVALGGGVEYELQTAGKPIGLFDVFGASDVEGTWQGVGVWKPLSAPEAAKASNAFNTSNLYGGMNGKDDADDDKPVLKRKHPKDSDSDDKTSSTGDSSKSSDTKSSTPDSDPDRPTMKRKSSDDSGSSTPSDSSSKSDPDQPTLHRKSSDDAGSSGSTASTDPDRPTLHRSHHAQDSDEAGTSNVAPDPDRPRLKHGKSDDAGSKEIARLTGFPPTMQQAVAVSDAATHPDHPWKYTWANPDDEARMKGLLEDIARKELGLDGTTPPAKTAKTTKSAAATKSATATKKVSMLPSKQPLPAELTDEHFRVFELAYGATATLVLTASTPKPAADEPVPDDNEPGPPVIKRGKPTATATAAPAKAPAKPAAKPAPQKFITLIAQPDLYGGILVLFKSTTDSAHLDETPRMRLVDAVDAMGDNRGELLFDLRSKTQRQFALYRVLRGSAEQLFATIVPQ